MSVCFCQTHSVTYDRALSHTWRLRNRTPTCAHTVDEGHRLLFTCWRHAAEQEGVYFSSKNSLHSSLVARSIYSKRSEPIPMKILDMVRSALLHSKSPSLQKEHELYLLIQIIRRNLSNLPAAKYMWSPQYLGSHVLLPIKITISLSFSQWENLSSILPFPCLNHTAAL